MKQMKDLEVGDSVYEPVLDSSSRVVPFKLSLFAAKDDRKGFEYVQLTTESGAVVALSRGHLLPAHPASRSDLADVASTSRSESCVLCSSSTSAASLPAKRNMRNPQVGQGRAVDRSDARESSGCGSVVADHRLHRAEDVEVGWTLLVSPRGLSEGVKRRHGVGLDEDVGEGESGAGRADLEAKMLPSVVTNVEVVEKDGQYAPLTGSQHATLVVDGVVVSQYTDFVDGVAGRGIGAYHILSPVSSVLSLLPQALHKYCVDVIAGQHDDLCAFRNRFVSAMYGDEWSVSKSEVCGETEVVGCGGGWTLPGGLGCFWGCEETSLAEKM